MYFLNIGVEGLNGSLDGESNVRYILSEPKQGASDLHPLRRFLCHQATPGSQLHPDGTGREQH